MWPPARRTLCIWPQPLNSYLGWGAKWHRAGGDCICEVCGFLYYDHPTPPFFEEEIEGGCGQRCPTMTVLCRGELVKL